MPLSYHSYGFTALFLIVTILAVIELIKYFRHRDQDSKGPGF